jgi:uncharacterized membrane protein
MRSSLSEDKWGDGFEKAILTCGDLLANYFPASAGQGNHLSNKLIIKK